jgi:hypothetical protein
MTPEHAAYYKAYKSGYTKELEEIACKNSFCAYLFARDVKGANIEYCQEKACKNPWHAYRFACDVQGADLNYCLEACKETEWYAKIQVHIMEEAIG